MNSRVYSWQNQQNVHRCCKQRQPRSVRTVLLTLLRQHQPRAAQRVGRHPPLLQSNCSWLVGHHALAYRVSECRTAKMACHRNTEHCLATDSRSVSWLVPTRAINSAVSASANTNEQLHMHHTSEDAVRVATEPARRAYQQPRSVA